MAPTHAGRHPCSVQGPAGGPVADSWPAPRPAWRRLGRWSARRPWAGATGRHPPSASSSGTSGPAAGGCITSASSCPGPRPNSSPSATPGRTAATAPSGSSTGITATPTAGRTSISAKCLTAATSTPSALPRPTTGTCPSRLRPCGRARTCTSKSPSASALPRTSPAATPRGAPDGCCSTGPSPARFRSAGSGRNWFGAAGSAGCARSASRRRTRRPAARRRRGRCLPASRTTCGSGPRPGGRTAAARTAATRGTTSATTPWAISPAGPPIRWTSWSGRTTATGPGRGRSRVPPSSRPKGATTPS